MSRAPRPTSQWQNWVFTAYHLNEDGVSVELLSSADVSTLPFKSPIAKAQWQLERCSKTGRIHIQGMVRMEKKLVFSTMKEILKLYFTNTVHLEGMEGSWQENLDYTSKKETHVSGPFRHNIRDPDSPFTRTVHYWWGPPGTGKSTSARKLLKEKGFDVYEVAKSSASKGTWLPGYSGQEGVIMDEVDYKWFDESGWKKVLDRMPQTVVAGAGGKNLQWDPEWIILISNYPPTKFLENAAIKSRIHKIVKFDKVLMELSEPEHTNASDFLSFLPK